MADPWTDDLAALDRRAHHQLHSFAATRASAIALADTASKESRMHFFKAHPVLAALAAVVFLGVAAPVAYAVVDRVVLAVDTEQSAPDIQQSLQQQLDQQHAPVTVEADKPDDHALRLKFKTHDPNAPALDVVDTDGQPLVVDTRGVELRVHCELTPDQQQRLASTVEDAESGAGSDADRAAAARAALAAQGFTEATVVISDHGGLTVDIAGPPTPH